MDAPMYRKIANDFIDKIEKSDLRPGDKIPTEAELGAEYGVSRITVSKAIRELQNMDLVYRVKGSGTFISEKSADSLAIQNKPANGMSIISVIFPQGEQNGAHEMLIGIESECAKDGFYVTIHNSRNKPTLERGIMNNLLNQGCGGLIVFPCYSAHENADLYSELIIRDFPIVFVDRRVDFFTMPLVACDNERAMRDLVTRLIESGHERIGFFCNSIETVSSEHERYKGYCEAHIAAGFRVKPDLMFRRYRHLEESEEIFDVNNMNRRHYADAALSFFLNAREKPTCIVAVNDILAIALMKAALAKNVRVPEDLSVTGFDDLYIAEHVEVPLTTVRQPFEKIGATAARILLDRIKGGSKPAGEVRIPAEIVFRESAKQAKSTEKKGA
jgi:GntR family transcriptional regulator of arabinose operon